MAGHILKILVFKLISLEKNIGQACSCQENHHISLIFKWGNSAVMTMMAWAPSDWKKDESNYLFSGAIFLFWFQCLHCWKSGQHFECGQPHALTQYSDGGWGGTNAKWCKQRISSATLCCNVKPYLTACTSLAPCHCCDEDWLTDELHDMI